MKFEDKNHLPFKVEIREGKNKDKNNHNNQHNKQAIHQQKLKQQQQEQKTHEVQQNLDNLKKKLEEQNSSKVYVNPLQEGFKNNLVEEAKKKALEEERKKKQIVAQRLYEEYKKRKEQQRKQQLENSQNIYKKKSLIAPKFDNKKTYNNTNNSSQNFQYNKPFISGGNNNFNTGFKKPFVSGFKKPLFATSTPNTSLGETRFSIYTSGLAKQVLNQSQSPSSSVKKKTINNKEKKNKTLSKEKPDNFDWRKYMENDEIATGSNKVKKNKNIHNKNSKTKKQTSITLTHGVSLTTLSKLSSIPIDNLAITSKNLGVKIYNMQEILDKDLVSLILESHNFICNFYDAEDEYQEFLKIDESRCTESRPPVVCVLGHVDHGKTSLLDGIKKTKVVDLEPGGITQNISLYQLPQWDNIIFIDTPGHNLFTAMRKVGVILTDIVILIVAADDGIKEQTKEIIDILKYYNKRIILCITKIDKVPNDSYVKMICNEISTKYELVPEEYGGEMSVVTVSNKTGAGIQELLEKIKSTKEIISPQLKYDKNREAIGIVVNAYIEKGFGIIVYILLQQGIVKVGDTFISGKQTGKVRFLFTPESSKTATPNNIIKLVGFEEIPVSGDGFVVINNNKLRSAILAIRNKPELAVDSGNKNNLLLELGKKKINILLKADTITSLDAINQSLVNLTNNRTQIKIFSSQIGHINENDVEKAKEFELIIVGYNVKNIKNKKEDESVKIISNNIIYHILEEISLLTQHKEIIKKEEEVGMGEVIQLFTFEKKVIAGCRVTEGKIIHGNKYMVEVLRNRKSIFTGKIDSMQKEGQKIKEANIGTEVGVIFENWTDLQLKDQIRCYKIVENTVILND